MSAPEFMVGTASWTDKTLIETTDFYPPDVKTAEDRLRFYAAQFRTVEVDSTFYAIPAERNAELWRERTPPGFVFNIKAFAWLTQHPTDASRLPKDIKQMLPEADRAKRRLGVSRQRCSRCGIQYVLEFSRAAASSGSVERRLAGDAALPVPALLRL